MTAVLPPPALAAPRGPAASSRAVCPSFIGARVLRATVLDACGRAPRGPRSQAVSNGFIQIETAPEVQEGEDYSTTRADGGLCNNESGPDSLKWLNVSIQFCQVDFDLFVLLNPTWKRVTNAAGTQSTGFRIGQSFSDRLGFALEVWPRVAGGDVGCDDLDDPGPLDPDDVIDPNGYFLLPWVIARAPDTWTLQNGTVTFTLRGRTRAGSRWLRGPYDVTRDINGSPAPLLVPIEDGRGSSGQRPYDPDHFHAEVVSVAPPEPTCGAIPLPPLVLLDQPDPADALTWRATINNGGDPLPDGTQAPVTVTWYDGDTITEDRITTAQGSVTHTFTVPGRKKVTVQSDSDDPALPLRRIVRFVDAITVTAVDITPVDPELLEGTAQQLVATATHSDGTSLPVTAVAAWSSSAPTIAAVTPAGVVSALAPGTAAITATYRGQSGTTQVTVTELPVTTVTVTPATASVEEGDTTQLAATATRTDGSTIVVTDRAAWTSSATGTATVDASGLVTGVAPGTATITAAYGGQSDTSTITVTELPVTAVTVTPATASVEEGDTTQLAATATRSDNSTIVVTDRAAWTSSATGTATVDASGLVTGVAAGTATITAAYGGQSDTSAITVTVPPGTLDRADERPDDEPDDESGDDTGSARSSRRSTTRGR
ncbi:Ig-like domain-containing protein [Saccharothrix sp. HUAS TT1]|uniref:Ig-like domain-containing protein n=1 Tax=unclassified Saccharothrix TaxID=2593673 RepID=UPI00345B844D